MRLFINCLPGSRIGPVVLFAVLALTACGSGEETDNAQVQADISPVIPNVPGTVLAIRTDDNQPAKLGDTLVILDDREFALRVQQADVAVQQAEANVILARKTAQTASSCTGSAVDNAGAASAGIAQAQAGIQVAGVRALQARQNFDRQAQLLEQQSTTRSAYDNAKAERDAADAQLNAARQQVTVLKQQASAARKQVTTVSNQAGVAGEGIRLAQLAVKQARANLETARLQHSYTVITAPATGIVSNKSVQVGQVVQPGQTLMQIAGNSKVWVIANFKETQVGEMRVGQPAEVKVDAYPDKVFKAKVESLSPATGARFSMLPPDNATGNFVKVTQRIPIRIALTETDPATPLRAGMSVAVTVN